MRYINVTIIDATGSATHTQIVTPNGETWGPAVEWMETKMTYIGRRYIACFMYDTRSHELLEYRIDGHRAVIVRRLS
jgi:hypothetical protein